ncbi:DNA topoisomerase [Lactobacillus sp. ESL0679]|uniref:DNA topoisomerase n=1 Tax=Lactobacillus sp. ESL0679 TaxID=2983209 RepID=UPI0023FA0DA3|nr:DNA topoisomerase [Lactobacillus sp. ESL0679]MDF7682336.1 DNA topoisomerase [Lactobacillus sp. ESL0679]
MKLLLLTEKTSAAKNFAKALGGLSGSFNHDSYQIVHAHGHLLQFKEPHEMVAQDKAAKYSDWHDLSNYPWNLLDFTWEKEVIPGMQKTLTNIKHAAQKCDAIVIATDDDPSGEGDLLGWEIVNAINWHKQVFRIRFADETRANIKKALLQKIDVTNQYQQGEFLEATGRERFDFASMQLSRIALIIARQAGFQPKTLRLGRLKSTIVNQVYQQETARQNYVKKSYYEVRFHDANQNTFTQVKNAKFMTPEQAKLELLNFHDSAIVVDDKIAKHQAPPDLLDLSHLAILVGKKGYASKEVLATYQKMYEAGILSYPRTEDTKITQEQFAELLPLVKQIAQVTHIDTKLLTHTTIRRKFLAKNATHGANRPGLNVPRSLTEIAQKFGKCGQAIYKAVAKSFLAILAEDYLYDQERAHLADYPKFTCTINLPRELNYKLIFDENDLNDTQDKQVLPFGPAAQPFVYEGHNPKPKAPTHRFIIDFLKKDKIGTGATQEQTLANISTGKGALIKNTKEKYSLTFPGLIQSILCDQTFIASPQVTEQLQNTMKMVKLGKFDYRNVPFLINQIVKHDLLIEQKNAGNLRKNPQLAKLQPANKHAFTPKTKVTGTWRGKDVAINQTWGKHTFNERELRQLFAGKSITFVLNKRTITGKLAKQTYHGHQFVGFKADFN